MDVQKYGTEVYVHFTLLRSIRGTIVWNTRETRNIYTTLKMSSLYNLDKKHPVINSPTKYL